MGGSKIMPNHKFKYIQAWLFFLSENAANCVLEVLNFHSFLGEHVPHTPYTSRHVIDEWTDL